MIKSGQAVTAVFTTHDATTGAAADATGTPTGVLYVNGTADAATVTVTNIATGRYKAAVTLPSLSAGDVVAIGIAATVNGVAGAGVVWSDVADTKRISDLNDLSAAAVNAEVDTALADYDGPTNAEMVARTLPAVDYFDPAADTVANVTTVGSVTTKTGYELTAAYDAAKTAASQTSVNDIPTNAELATALSNITISQQVIEDAVAAALAGASIEAEVDAAALAAAVWQNAVRTLTAAAVVGPSAQIDGGDIAAHRGDTFHMTMTGLGDLTQRDELWFTVKRGTGDSDAHAQIQITETGGLLIVARAPAATAAHGTLTVTDAAAGVVDIDIDEAATALMPADRRMSWDIQMKAGGTVTTLATGTIQFSADVTQAV